MKAGNFQSRRGATLIELMMGLVLLLVAATAVSSLSRLAAEKGKFDSARIEEASISRLLRSQLEFPDTCSGNLVFTGGGANLGAFPEFANDTVPVSIRVPGLLNGVNGDVLTANTLIPGVGIRIRNIEFYNWMYILGSFTNAVNPDTGVLDTAEYVASLRFEYDYDIDGNVATQERALLGGTGGRRVSLGSVVVSVNSNGWASPLLTGIRPNSNNVNIVRCHGAAGQSTAEDTCNALNCEFDNAANICRCGFPEVGCPPGSLLTGFRNGVERCESIGGSCPADQYLVGVGLPPNGATCAPLPVYTGPPPPTPTPVPTSGPTPTATPTPTGSACVPNNGLATNSYVCPSNGYNGNTVPINESECCSGYGEATCPTCPGSNCSAIDVPIFCKPAPTPTPSSPGLTAQCICWTRIMSTVMHIPSSTGSCPQSRDEGTVEAGECYAGGIHTSRVVDCYDPNATHVANGCSSAPYCLQTCTGAGSPDPSVETFWSGAAYSSQAMCEGNAGPVGVRRSSGTGTYYRTYCRECVDRPGMWHSGNAYEGRNGICTYPDYD